MPASYTITGTPESDQLVRLDKPVLLPERRVPIAVEPLSASRADSRLSPRMPVCFQARHVLQILLGGDGILPNPGEHGRAGDRHE